MWQKTFDRLQKRLLERSRFPLYRASRVCEASDLESTQVKDSLIICSVNRIKRTKMPIEPNDYKLP